MTATTLASTSSSLRSDGSSSSSCSRRRSLFHLSSKTSSIMLQASLSRIGAMPWANIVDLYSRHRTHTAAICKRTARNTYPEQVNPTSAKTQQDITPQTSDSVSTDHDHKDDPSTVCEHSRARAKEERKRSDSVITDRNKRKTQIFYQPSVKTQILFTPSVHTTKHNCKND